MSFLISLWGTWIGFRENLQESALLNGKNPLVFPVDFPFNQFMNEIRSAGSLSAKLVTNVGSCVAKTPNVDLGHLKNSNVDGL